MSKKCVTEDNATCGGKEVEDITVEMDRCVVRTELCGSWNR